MRIAFRRHIRLLPLVLLVGLLCLPAAILNAEPEPALPVPAANAELPETLGRIVYQTSAPAARRIFIIANGHRSALSGANAANIVQAQLETFRIGEWLINRQQVALLLPEGFFGEMAEKTVDPGSSPPDNRSLRATLEDRSQFVNAELLLHRNYGICLEQVEDRALYRSAREQLRLSFLADQSVASRSRLELDGLQLRRTAAILQSAPAAIDKAYRQGQLEGSNAMLTIGLSHLDDIVAFLEAGAINIAPLHTATADFPAEASELELMKHQVGVTVIVPHSLVALLPRK